MSARRRWLIAAAFLALGGCATQEASVGVGAAYDSWYYDPWYDWYGGGAVCCVNYPDDIGPPHPEHPIVLPPGSDPRPTHPIANPPGGADVKPSNPIASQPKATPAPRPAAMPRGGGGMGGGMRGGGGGRR